MLAYEKGKMLKSTIEQLYINEGRSKSYISNLLKIDRTTLRRLINEWNFCQLNQYKGKICDYLKSNKEKVISMAKNNCTRSEICKETGIGMNFFKKVIEYDSDIKDALQFTTFLEKEVIIHYPDEEWRPILGYEKYYISNYGRIKTDIGFIKTSINIKSGYIYVNLYSAEGKRKGFRVHRLVAHAFCPGNSEVRNVVNHIDGNIQNNYYKNLEWVTAGENNQHSYDILNRVHKGGGKINYTIIYKDKYEFKTISAFARFANISISQAKRWIDESSEKHQIKKIYKQ